MSEPPVVEMTMLDAKALRELVEGLIAEAKRLADRMDLLEQRLVIIPTVMEPVSVGPSTQPYWKGLPITCAAATAGTEAVRWWGDPNDAPCPPPASAN